MIGDRIRFADILAAWARTAQPSNVHIPHAANTIGLERTDTRLFFARPLEKYEDHRRCFDSAGALW